MNLQTYERSLEQWEETKPRGRVLLAEDNRAMREFLEIALRQRGYEVVSARGGPDLLAVLEEQLTDYEMPPPGTVIVSDLRMPRIDGFRVLERMRSLGWSIPVILITAFGDEEAHKQAETLGAFAMLDKPFEIGVLVQRIREALSCN
jgi:CheY-like chemotaxis protein